MSKQGWGTKNQQRTVDNLRNTQNQLIKQGRMLPVPITNLAASSNLKTRGSQVGFLVTSLQGVDQIVLLRNYSRDFGSAQQIHVWSAAALKTTPQTYPLHLQHTDADPANAGQKCYYWVKVVPKSDLTTSNTFISGPQLLDASQQPNALQITGDFPATQAYTPTTQPLTAVTGVPVNAATINIASFQIQYPFDTDQDGDADLISYNSGSITGLLDNTLYYLYFNDPTYAGGAETYIASINNPDLTAGLYRQYIGNITTPTHGGGGTGGQGGGGGSGGPPCFSGNTRVHTKRGIIAISSVKSGDRVMTRAGWRMVTKVLEHDYAGEMLEMDAGELVTPWHRFHRGRRGEAGEWVQARKLFSIAVPFVGKVFNLVLAPTITPKNPDDPHCYLLGNGRFAHNMRKF